MKIIGTIHGSAQQALPVVIGKDTVYIHSNIQPVGNGLYQYDEIQMTLDEYVLEQKFFNSLPLSVVAEMIEEEVAAASAELNLEEVI